VFTFGKLIALQVLVDALAETNAAVHAQHQEYQRMIAPLDERAAVVSDIERERSQAEMLTQDANALAYESAQYRAADVWALAAPSRLKIYGMRAKVFDTGRRLRPGVRGARGRYTHLQWTLDGEGRLVDQLGRTESEAEEEEGLPRVGPRLLDEEEVDVVPNPTMRPTWLLRFFHSWRARWTASKSADSSPPPEEMSPSPPPEVVEEE
jgi:hypothetical protein